MSDMLVKLYDLPENDDCMAKLVQQGIEVRRAMAPEKLLVVDWVLENFGKHWASECDVSFSNQPISCYIAVKDKEIIGFGCYNSTVKDFFGPTGVRSDMRGHGIGKALLLACLKALKAEGYAYAIIGGAGPKDFYAKIVGATVIDGSEPGIYKGLL